MATAMSVGDFSVLCRARALSMNPTNWLPQSPRKIVAGLKLNRRKPRIAPASAMVSKETSKEWLEIATTKTTRVENNAEPAARPSRPSMRLNAFVIPMTQRIVIGNPTIRLKWWAPNRTGNSRILRPPANSKAPAIA